MHERKEYKVSHIKLEHVKLTRFLCCALMIKDIDDGIISLLFFTLLFTNF